jgi:D-sedoheptulose 7-phosphate isomerase
VLSKSDSEASKVVLDKQEKLAQGRRTEVASTEEYFSALSQLIPRLPYAAIDGIVGLLLRAFAGDRTVFVFGNGGSAASASHMMVDMNKGTAQETAAKQVKVIALTDNVPLLTAWANDAGYEQVFAEQLKSFVREGDVALAISTSGNSANVLLALQTALDRGASTVGLTGFEGGKMKALCGACAVVPSDNVQMIEDMHHAILHSIFTVVRKRLHSTAPLATAASAGSRRK